MDLRAALENLDPANDSHWTAAGLPSVQVVRDSTGDQSVTRDEIRAFAPLFNRTEQVLPPEQKPLIPNPNLNPAEVVQDAPVEKEPVAEAGDVETEDAKVEPEVQEVEEPEVEKDPLKVKERQVAALREDMAVLDGKLSEINSAIDMQMKKKSQIAEEINQVQASINKLLGPGDDFRIANQNYLEAQKKNLAVRAKQIERLKEAQQILDDGKFPIDRKFGGHHGGPIHIPK